MEMKAHHLAFKIWLSMACGSLRTNLHLVTLQPTHFFTFQLTFCHSLSNFYSVTAVSEGIRYSRHSRHSKDTSVISGVLYQCFLSALLCSGGSPGVLRSLLRLIPIEITKPVVLSSELVNCTVQDPFCVRGNR